MSSTEVALFERIEDSYVQVIEQNIRQFSDYLEGGNR
jgi:hypothetical protein